MQKDFAEVGHGVMIRMEAARKQVERHRLVGRPCNLAGTEGACGGAIKQQTSKHFRCDGLATAWTRVGVDRTEVQVRDHVDDEACQMVRRETCTQRDGGIEGGFIIGGCEFSAPVPSARYISAYGQRVLSDRLLAGTLRPLLNAPPAEPRRMRTETEALLPPTRRRQPPTRTPRGTRRASITMAGRGASHRFDIASEMTIMARYS